MSSADRDGRIPARGVVRGHVVVAVGILRDRLDEPWTLSALASEVHLSRSQVVRAFDTTVGTSPMAYLRQMRVERMARLLATTDLSVAEIARSVGWRNQFHASRCFHAQYGISPTALRHRLARQRASGQAETSTATPDPGWSGSRGLTQEWTPDPLVGPGVARKAE